MHPNTQNFKPNAKRATEDANLRTALSGLATGFVARRKEAIAGCPSFEALRDKGRAIRHTTFHNLAEHLRVFETNAERAGAQVHWAETSTDACAITAEICRDANAKTVVKGKSMVSEEIGLNDDLIARGFDVVETDLGEYLLQVREETPSHIIAPAIHLTEHDARDTFLAHHQQLAPDRDLETPEDIVAEARQILRSRFLEADVGITGANFLIAETGSAVVVTNEGNGDLTATVPRVHIIIASIDKIVPTLSDVGTLLQLLARSATGQAMTAYTSFFTGPKRQQDLDGPEACHIVLVDNGRSELLNSDAAEVLNCIRCGACLNHCPVYGAIGGHAYGWVYPGPIGAALNPGLLGLSQTHDLPHASTLCGHCEAVCPVKIPLPKLFRQWRRDDFNQRRGSFYNLTLSIWAWLARRPKLYGYWAQLAAWTLSSRQGVRCTLPFARAWTRYRDMPTSQGMTFQVQWSRRQGQRNKRP